VHFPSAKLVFFHKTPGPSPFLVRRALSSSSSTFLSLDSYLFFLFGVLAEPGADGSFGVLVPNKPNRDPLLFFPLSRLFFFKVESVSLFSTSVPSPTSTFFYLLLFHPRIFAFPPCYFFYPFFFPVTWSMRVFVPPFLLVLSQPNAPPIALLNRSFFCPPPPDFFLSVTSVFSSHFVLVLFLINVFFFCYSFLRSHTPPSLSPPFECR